MFDELVSDHEADFGIRRKVGKLDQGGEGVVELVGLFHALGVLQEVLPGVGQEAFRRSDLTEFQIG